MDGRIGLRKTVDLEGANVKAGAPSSVGKRLDETFCNRLGLTMQQVFDNLQMVLPCREHLRQPKRIMRLAVGPIRFDPAVRWTVRVPVDGDCTDGEASPHGHVRFFFDVKPPRRARLSGRRRAP